jgi:hypothetical protein
MELIHGIMEFIHGIMELIHGDLKIIKHEFIRVTTSSLMINYQFTMPNKPQ